MFSVDKIGSDKSNILKRGVPQIFATWIDRLCYCLGHLSFITDCESIKKHLPKCFKPEYEDVLFANSPPALTSTNVQRWPQYPYFPFSSLKSPEKCRTK